MSDRLALANAIEDAGIERGAQDSADPAMEAQRKANSAIQQRGRCLSPFASVLSAAFTSEVLDTEINDRAPGRQGSMTARAPQRTDTATTIIHDAIAEYKSRHGLMRKNLSKQQRHAIGKAKISYVMGNLNEEELLRIVEYALTGVAALVPPTTDDTR